MDKPLTMVRILHEFNAGEKAIMCKALRERTVRYSGAHQGLLPFIEAKEVCAALNMQTAFEEHRRPCNQLCYKLRRKISLFENMAPRCIMHLDDGKIAKWFGKHPELGRVLPGMAGSKKVTCSVKWSLPKQDYISDTEVLVRPTVALKPVKKGLWEIIVAPEYRQRAELWLIDRCR